MKVIIDPNKKITLYNPEFDEMRKTLDDTIQKTLRVMTRKGMSAAAIGLKIEIVLIKAEVKDDNAPTGIRESVTPDIGYKITSVIQDKDDIKGDVIRKGSGKEMLMDDTGSFFFVDHEEASGQLSMFNGYDEYVEEVTGGGDDEEDD